MFLNRHSSGLFFCLYGMILEPTKSIECLEKNLFIFNISNFIYIKFLFSFK
jgi:hypothetical protein